MIQGIRVSKLCCPLYLGFWMIIGAGAATPGAGYAQTQSSAQVFDQNFAEIPYRDGKVIIAFDYMDTVGDTYRATGHVRITFQDMVITCDGAEYNGVTHKGTTSGRTHFSQKKAWFDCSRSEFDLSTQTAKFFDATGYTDEEFYVQGRIVLKTGRDTYSVDQGSLTSCQEKRPKWQFNVGNANIHLDQTARLHRVLFKVHGVPLFYFPYLIVPLEEKKRSSGFMPPHSGNSTTKGRQFRLVYYQTLGTSAELTTYGDYFSKRGFGMGGIFTARPNEQTDLHVEAYGVNDRLNQGGAHLLVDGESQFENGFRAAAKVNITTNFAFRQVFADGFRSATIPEEQAIVYATRAFDSFSTNFAFDRREVFFPGRSLVIQKSPSIEFASLGKSLGKLPLILYLRAAAEGLYRSDSIIKTPSMVQRLDFYPRLALRLPSLAGFSILPSAGIRETYYSARLSDGSQPAVVTAPLRRQYTDLEIELRTPGLEKSFHSTRFGDFRHLIEPTITYRRIHGITELGETIRFDDQDAIADTNEIEYGLVNRIMRRREVRPGVSQDYEFLEFKVVQKYYFDPTFGGAFIPGEANLFYPLDTLTGFATAGIERTLSPTSMSLQVTPKPSISYSVRADYDTKLSRLRDASLWATWRHDMLLFSGTYVKTNATEPGMFPAHNVQVQVGFKNPEQRGFSGSMSFSYNISNSTLLNSNSRLNYLWNCCGVYLEFQQYALGLRTESRLTFSFTLKGIGHFGNLKRPESLF